MTVTTDFTARREAIAAVQTWNQYQSLAAATAIYPSRGANFTYTACGLAGESGEFAEKVADLAEGAPIEASELAAELGDVLWYVAMGADELGLPLGSMLDADNGDSDIHCLDVLTSPDQHGDGSHRLVLMSLRLFAHAGRASEHAKKAIRDDNGEMTHERSLKAELELVAACGVLGELATLLGTSLSELAIGNLTKLVDRAERNVLGGSGDNR